MEGIQIFNYINKDFGVPKLRQDATMKKLSRRIPLKPIKANPNLCLRTNKKVKISAGLNYKI